MILNIRFFLKILSYTPTNSILFKVFFYFRFRNSNFVHSNEICSMNDLNNLITAIEQQFALLMQRIEVLEQQNSELRLQLKDAETVRLKLNESLVVITKEYDTLKVTNALLGSEDYKRETKLKINSLIRDIDHCISQLSQ